jgi:hypothetical protein
VLVLNSELNSFFECLPINQNFINKLTYNELVQFETLNRKNGTIIGVTSEDGTIRIFSNDMIKPGDSMILLKGS